MRAYFRAMWYETCLAVVLKEWGKLYHRATENAVCFSNTKDKCKVEY